MDVVAVLEEQHGDIARRLDDAARSPRGPRRARLVHAALVRVHAHVVAERVHLYRACHARFPLPADELAAALAAHGRARVAAARVAALAPTDERLERRLRALQASFGRHVHADEARLLQRAKAWLADSDLDVLGDAITASYRTLVARGVPAAWPSSAHRHRPAERA